MSQTSVTKTPSRKAGTRRQRSVTAKGKKGTPVRAKSAKPEDIFGMFDRDPAALEKELSTAFHEAKRKAVQENQSAAD
jgi:hypothetical protein